MFFGHITNMNCLTLIMLLREINKISFRKEKLMHRSKAHKSKIRREIKMKIRMRGAQFCVHRAWILRTSLYCHYATLPTPDCLDLKGIFWLNLPDAWWR